MASWKDDEAAFREKFGISYSDFVEMMNVLPEEDLSAYEKIREVSERAAILWAIDQGRQKKIFPFSKNEVSKPPQSFQESLRDAARRIKEMHDREDY